MGGSTTGAASGDAQLCKGATTGMWRLWWTGACTGQGALKLLGDILGVSGAGPQQAYFDSFQTDPGFMASLDAGTQALNRAAAPRGLRWSGGQAQSLFDFGQRHFTDYLNNRTSNLFNLAGFGQNAATNSANLVSGAGNNIAGAQFGTGQLFGNNAINTGNAMAQSRGVGINNLLGLGNMFAKFVNPLSGLKLGA